MENLNELLVELGISKVRLAKYLGVSRQMLYNYLALESLSLWPKEKEVRLLALLNIDNENESEEKDQTENQASSSVESDIDSSISTDNTIIQNEIIEIPESEEPIHTNTNIGILSFTGIFLLFRIIFTIIFTKDQQNAHKNVSK